MNEFVNTWDLLGVFAQEMPQWLKDYQSAEVIDVESIRHSRVGYYPGAGNDGSLVKCCNKAHCVHLFILADFCYGKWYKDSSLKGVKGYDIIGDFDLPDLTQRKTQYHVPLKMLVRGAPRTAIFPGPYTPHFNMVIYQRQSQYDRTHGAERFAVIFARYDGIALYDILFANGFFTNLFIVLNQEHGFGGNYDTYVNLMQRIALNSGVFPRFILTEDRNLWHNYRKEYTNPIMGGMHCSQRYIYSYKPYYY